MKEIVAGFLSLLLTSLAIGQVTPGPPNIIVILADDLGYGDLSFNGCPDFTTPNIDALMASGVRFSNGYVTHPFCSPSRAAILTGRYQQRFGHENNPTDDTGNPRLGLPQTEILLPQLLKPAGYVCGCLGKWHLGEETSLHPLRRGFDEFYGFLAGSSPYLNAPLLRGYTPVVEKEYITDAFAREAESFIANHAAQPFFLYLAFNAPHTPCQATKEYLARVPNITNPLRRTLAATIIAMDDAVGQVVAALNEQNLLNKTLIVFLSDNGAAQSTYVRNLPFRGYKFDTLEGGIHVPFVMSWPGQIPAGSTYDQPVSSLDIVATAAAAAGVTLPVDRTYDGLNLLPYVQGTQLMPDRALFWRWFGLGPTGPSGSQNTISAVRHGDLKLITERAADDQPPALYNVTDDITESNNLAGAQPADVIALQSLYDQWNSRMIAPLWQLNSTFLFNYGNAVTLAGDWNGFNIQGPSPWSLTRITAPGQNGSPDGFNWWTGMIYVAQSGGDTVPGTHSYVIVGGKSYDNQWGGVQTTIDGVTTAPYFSSGGLCEPSTISLAAGFYYSFRFPEPLMTLHDSLSYGVMKTSAPPVIVSCAGQTPAAPTATDPITVTISTDKPKSPEEEVFLRWSLDNFITSQLVPATASGSTFVATIPAQPTGTNVQYAAITTTAALNSLMSSKDLDPVILSTSQYYSVVVGDPQHLPPVISQQPVNQKVTAGQTATFVVSASGEEPLTYQWRKNGVDIVGAVSESYTTPPTTTDDDGSGFTVVVTNPGGMVISVAARLTVTSIAPPVIVRQPADVRTKAGRPARFEVFATGKKPLSYQWQRNGSNIPGATTSTYKITAVTGADNGAVFDVVVTNSGGSVTSRDALLSVH